MKQLFKNLIGFRRAVHKAAPANLNPVSSYGGGGGWWPIIRESYTGAWQQNVEVRRECVLAYSTVYSCISLIATDIGKLRLKLVQQENGIWAETTNPAFSPVLRKPNHFQTRIKFFEQWIISKLAYGNTYVLKQRDNRNIVTELYVLDPCRVTPLVAPDGSVYYRLTRDDLAGISENDVILPASEIIHDVMVPLYHPLCGVSPIYACGLAAVQGLAIQNNSARFFQNGSRPGGVLTAPGAISDDTAARLKAYWDANFTGENVGKVAVLGDGLAYEGMTIAATDAQLIEQLKWTAETVCSCFHVPGFMVGVGTPPAYTNIEALSQQYYSQCLQGLIEAIESSLDDGLALKDGLGTEFDLDDLLRMDTAAKVKATAEAIGAGFLKPNEARAKFDMAPVDGGDTPYLQQQNYSLAALAKRDAKEDPFGGNKPAAPPQAPANDTQPADGGDVQNEAETLRRDADCVTQHLWMNAP